MKYLFLFFSLAILSTGFAQDFVLECVGSDKGIEIEYHPYIAKLVKLSADVSQLDQKPEAEKLKREIEDNICEKYAFQNVYITIIRYFPEKIYVTIDVIEKGEREFPFLREPQGHYHDPDDIFAKWDEYMLLSLHLFEKGEIGTEDMQKAEGAWHVLFGHRHPLLLPYLKLFKDLVRKHQKILEQIFLECNDAHKRANAAFLLAYMDDGQKLADIMSHRLYDGSPEVRNNAIRVLAYLLKDHPTIALPVERIAEILHFPTVLDRNKAVSFLYLLSENPLLLMKYKALLLEKVPVLLQMLYQKQPNIREPAHGLLKNLTKQDFALDAVSAWELYFTENHKCGEA